MQEIFKKRTNCAVLDLPTHLSTLSSQFPPEIIDTQKLINNHSLFPYYRPFISNERADNITSFLLSDNDGGKVHIKLGITASSVSNPKNLRYCSLCFTDDNERYGEPYWHRVHQLPGVHVCPKHRIELSVTNINYSSRRGKHQYLTLIDKPQDLFANLPIGSDFYSHLIYIAEQSQLLLMNKCDAIGLENIRNRYLKHLAIKGYIYPTVRMKMSALCSDLKSFYGLEFLNFIDCSLDTSEEHSWLHRLLRSTKSACHPLRHLILLRFLDLTIPEFLERDIDTALPFGSGPWPCLNVVCKNYKKLVIKNFSLRWCSKSKLPIGTFNCICGFTYSRSGPDKSKEDIYKIGRIKEFGPVWIDKCMEVSKNDKFSLREKARKLGVDPKTILKYSQGTQEGNKNSTEKNVQKNNERRRILIDCLTSIKDPTRSKIRREIPSVYMWLYRYDKEWFEENLPAKARKNTPSFRVNWEERDRIILVQVEQAIRSLMEMQGKPKRVTKVEVARRTDAEILILYSLNRLPLTKEYLLQHIESTIQYQNRKINWAAKKLIEERGFVIAWEVKKLAGISNLCSDEINQYIIKICNNREHLMI